MAPLNFAGVVPEARLRRGDSFACEQATLAADWTERVRRRSPCSSRLRGGKLLLQQSCWSFCRPRIGSLPTATLPPCYPVGIMSTGDPTRDPAAAKSEDGFVAPPNRRVSAMAALPKPNAVTEPDSGRAFRSWSLHVVGCLAGVAVAWGLCYGWANDLHQQFRYAGTLLNVFGLANVAVGLRRTAKRFTGFGEGGISMRETARLQLYTATGGLKLEAIGLGWMILGSIFANLSTECAAGLVALGLTWPN